MCWGDLFGRRLLKKLDSTEISSITLDIFDTILLRRIQLEEKQFRLVAKK